MLEKVNLIGKVIRILVARGGIEPPTQGFSELLFNFNLYFIKLAS
jgi:hypothetical protein